MKRVRKGMHCRGSRRNEEYKEGRQVKKKNGKVKEERTEGKEELRVIEVRIKKGGDKYEGEGGEIEVGEDDEAKRTQNRERGGKKG